MVKVKAGAGPSNLILLAAAANAHSEHAAELARGLDPARCPDLVVTSGTDGRHMAGSRHYTGQALDLRSTGYGTRAAKMRFLELWMARLGQPIPVQTPTGPGYQTRNGKWLAILEHEGRRHEHFHGEEN